MSAPDTITIPIHAPETRVSQTTTAATLLRHVHTLTNLIRQRLGAPDELVVVCRDRERFLTALLAAWQVGARVALPPNAQRGTLEAITEGDMERVLHDGPGTKPGLEADPAMVLDEPAIDVKASLDRATRPDTSPPRPEPVELHAHTVLASLYTSGSTGHHRVFPKTAAQLFGEADALIRQFELDDETTVVSTVPPHHIYGLLFSVLVPLRGGGRITRSTPLHAETVARILRETEADVLVSVPAHLRSLQILPPGTLPDLRCVFSSSAPLPGATARTLHDRFGIHVTEVLGSTETGGIAWRRRLRDAAWRPLDGVEVAEGEDGQLLVNSSFLPPDAPRPWPCDDRIEMLDPDGHTARFTHLGRIDDVIKVGGKRITIGEMRRRLMQIDGVEDAAVQAFSVTSGHQRALRAAVVAEEHTRQTLRRALRTWFDPVVLPKRIVFVERLPRDARGKLTHDALAAIFDARAPEQSATPPSRDDESADADALEPRIESHTTHGDTARVVARVDVPGQLALFRGHFPGRPILSGVAQIAACVLPVVREAWPELAALDRLRRVKFRAPIVPNQALELRVERRGSSADVRFSIYVCAAGADVLDDSPPATSGVASFHSARDDAPLRPGRTS